MQTLQPTINGVLVWGVSIRSWRFKPPTSQTGQAGGVTRAADVFDFGGILGMTFKPFRKLSC